MLAAPFAAVLGLFWNLLIAYTGFESYFGVENVSLPFFSWPSLLTTLNLGASYPLDAMCAVRLRKSRLQAVLPWRRRRSGLPTRRESRVSELAPSNHKTLCQLSDRLLSSLGECESLCPPTPFACIRESACLHVGIYLVSGKRVQE